MPGNRKLCYCKIFVLSFCVFGIKKKERKKVSLVMDGKCKDFIVIIWKVCVISFFFMFKFYQDSQKKKIIIIIIEPKYLFLLGVYL